MYRDFSNMDKKKENIYVNQWKVVQCCFSTKFGSTLASNNSAFVVLCVKQILIFFIWSLETSIICIKPTRVFGILNKHTIKYQSVYFITDRAHLWVNMYIPRNTLINILHFVVFIEIGFYKINCLLYRNKRINSIFWAIFIRRAWLQF